MRPIHKPSPTDDRAEDAGFAEGGRTRDQPDGYDEDDESWIVVHEF